MSHTVETVGRLVKNIRRGTGGVLIVETVFSGAVHNTVTIDTADTAVRNILKSMGWKPPKVGSQNV